MNGYELIKLSFEAGEWTMKALRATGRMYHRTWSLMDQHPEVINQEILNTYFAMPRTSDMLKQWLDEQGSGKAKGLSEETLRNRIAVCAHICEADDVVEYRFHHLVAQAKAAKSKPMPPAPPPAE